MNTQVRLQKSVLKNGGGLGVLKQFDPAALLVLGGCVVLVLIGGMIFPSFLTFKYLLQQLQISAFLGVIATGAMLVILLGHIDMSVPWAITSTAIVITTLAGTGHPVLVPLAIPLGLLFGCFIGLINGIGVAVFRIPSMVWTLANNSILLGVVVFYTGGFKPKGATPDIAQSLALGSTFGLPNALLVWIGIGLLAFFFLERTVWGKYLYAMGNSQKAVFLSGVRVGWMTIATFVAAGLMTAVGALLLVGYANQAYQGMGDPYMMPVISAVVIGGTSILGGRGSYLGTVAGALFITLLSSILSVLQMPEAIRQIVFGAIILGTLLVNRRRSS